MATNILTAGISAAALLMITACSKKDDKSIDNTEQTVDVTVPQIDSVTVYREYPAQLKPASDVAVVARISGNITGKHFKDGQYVKKGDLLFTIESTQYNDAVEQAKASLATAKAQTEYARKQYAAMQEAIKCNAVSQMELEKSKSALDQGLASVQNAEATLRDALNSLGYCSVRALGNGHISAATVDVGDYVSSASQPLATIYDDSSLQAEFAIEETGYLQLVSNPSHPEFKKIPVTFSDTIVKSYSGIISYIAPDVDISTGTLTVKVSIDNHDNELKSGMYAIVHLPTEILPHAMLVKDASISTDQLGKYLYTVNDSDKVVYTPIEVAGLYQDTLRIVNSGITPQSRYVTKALLKVRDGMKVKPNMVK